MDTVHNTPNRLVRPIEGIVQNPSALHWDNSAHSHANQVGRRELASASASASHPPTSKSPLARIRVYSHSPAEYFQNDHESGKDVLHDHQTK